MYDVSSPNALDPSSIVLSPNLPTLHPDVKIHEVKTYTRENGDHLVGLGLVRSGMCILRFDQNWGNIDTLYQMYDFDRTLFPDTIINPNKDYFNPNFTGNPADGENNKWDWRISHSVLPYDMGGGRFVLTTDEYTRFEGFQNISGSWLDPPYETQDYFLPNLYAINDTGSGYFKGKLVATGIPIAVSLNEDESHRLNYLHRNHPAHSGTDPNKLQGAFLRIWDRDSLGNNTLSSNTGGMILNAYDPGEDSSNPVGYFGRSGIPDTAMVPFGVHEPILVEAQVCEHVDPVLVGMRVERLWLAVGMDGGLGGLERGRVVDKRGIVLRELTPGCGGFGTLEFCDRVLPHARWDEQREVQRHRAAK